MSNSLPEPPKLPPLPQRPNLNGGNPAPQQPVSQPQAPQAPAPGAPQFGGGQQGFGTPEQQHGEPQIQGFGAPQFGGQSQPSQQPEQNQGFGAPQFGDNQAAGQAFGAPQNVGGAGYPPNFGGGTPPVPEDPNKKSRLPWILGAAGAVVVLVGGGLVFVNLNNNDSGNTADPGSSEPGGTTSEDPGTATEEPTDPPVASVDVTEVHSVTLENGSTLKFGLAPDATLVEATPWSDDSLMSTGGYSVTVGGVECRVFASAIPDLMEDVDPSRADYVYDSFVSGFIGEPSVGGGNTIGTVSFEETTLASPDAASAIPGRHYTIPATSSTTVYSTMYVGVDFDRAPRSLAAVAYACQTQEALDTIEADVEAGNTTYTVYTWIE